MRIEGFDETGRLGLLRYSANWRISQDEQRLPLQLVAHTPLQGVVRRPATSGLVRAGPASSLYIPPRSHEIPLQIA